ncbi:hypothetical protein C0585_04585 [Candidatus Woesearchaeota archaeon]|nr:MAG: hypothetical protein C0585_04585 [Candidatus Woesearchaeota archaeon]
MPILATTIGNQTFFTPQKSRNTQSGTDPPMPIYALSTNDFNIVQKFLRDYNPHIKPITSIEDIKQYNPHIKPITSIQDIKQYNPHIKPITSIQDIKQYNPHIQLP